MLAVFLIIVLTPLGFRGMIKSLNLGWSPQSVLSLSTDYPDVFGFGILLPRLVVNIHPALTHTLDCYCPAIYFHVININRR